MKSLTSMKMTWQIKKNLNGKKMAILLLNQVRDKKYNFFFVLKFKLPILKQVENMQKKNSPGSLR